MALLGEMYYKPDGIGSWYNLPREAGIAYAAQESWVLNETIKVRLNKYLFISPDLNYHLYRTISFWGNRLRSNGTRKVRRPPHILVRLLNIRPKVLNQCALERDLSLWEAGDMTEVERKVLL